MWFWILLIIIVVGIILFRKSDTNSTSVKKEKSMEELLEELKKHTSNQETSCSNVSIDYMPVDPEKYTLDLGGRRLVSYHGTEDELFVPFGTYIIGNDENEIKNGKAWDRVYIPRSVTTIHDLALTKVEAVYYEGSRAEFSNIKIGKMNFYTGFVPNYAANMPPEYAKHSTVKEVKFYYDTNLREIYKMSAEKRKASSSNSKL